MAKNWTVAEAIVALREGNKEAQQELGARFPITTCNAFTEEGLMNIIKALPEKVTMRVIETALKDGVQVGEVCDEPVEEENVKKETAKAEEPKKERKTRTKKVEPVEEPEEEEEAEEGYASMSAKELFDECKKRGISCKPKMAKEKYIEMLEKHDNEAKKAKETSDDDWGEDDDWDEEEEEVKPAKKEEKKAEKKPAKKAPAKKPDPVEDEDDEDWEI